MDPKPAVPPELPDERNQPTVFPVIEEELVVGKKTVKTGAVRVHKRVQERTEHVEMSLLRETVEVRCVVVNQVITTAPQIRTEGDITIIPVVEEEIVVTKRLVLKEELHLTRRRTRTTT
jgi:uncharacterized protein (TIGR02271 family)